MVKVIGSSMAIAMVALMPGMAPTAMPPITAITMMITLERLNASGKARMRFSIMGPAQKGNGRSRPAERK
jgi:hypothetical protein